VRRGFELGTPGCPDERPTNWAIWQSHITPPKEAAINDKTEIDCTDTSTGPLHSRPQCLATATRFDKIPKNRFLILFHAYYHYRKKSWIFLWPNNFNEKKITWWACSKSVSAISICNMWYLSKPCGEILILTMFFFYLKKRKIKHRSFYFFHHCIFWHLHHRKQQYIVSKAGIWGNRTTDKIYRSSQVLQGTFEIHEKIFNFHFRWIWYVFTAKAKFKPGPIRNQALQHGFWELFYVYCVGPCPAFHVALIPCKM